MIFTQQRKKKQYTAKHFIIDDICCYIGSQNLYLCDLAEWGVVLDNPDTVQSIKAQYWDPMWATSYMRDDCEVDKVMDGLNISREAANKYELTKLQIEQCKQKMRAAENIPARSIFHAKPKPGDDDEEIDVASEPVSEGED